MRVLCTADIHVGRRSSRLPDRVDKADASCARAWKAIVDLAVDADVDVVAIAGDVVDRANCFFEAVGPLKAGLQRLVESGIDVVAVAGNHDFDVFPELVRTLQSPRLRLVGARGTWERVTIERRGERLHVDGWSFPREHVREDPLEGYDLPTDDSTPALGLLHCDLDAKSGYAPVALARLFAVPHDLWLLGHIHTPRTESDRTSTVIYPGSPQAMNPGETGSHGVVIAELRPNAPVGLQTVPLSSVRYEGITVDLSDVQRADGIRETVFTRLQSAAAAVVQDQDALRYLLIRAAVTGTTEGYSEVRNALANLEVDFDVPIGNAAAFIESVTLDAHAPLNLEELARVDDPRGAAARVILELDSGKPGEGVKKLMAEAAKAADRVRYANAYQSVSSIDDGIDHAAVRASLRRQALALLDQFRSQTQGAM